MARVPDEELERLKREVSVQRLAEARGVKLKKHGKDLMGLCPFHDDREPSLVISPEKNLWHCLGACQAGGSVIDWVMRAEGVSFRHAAELLRADIPSLAASVPLDPERMVKRSTVKKLEDFADVDESDGVVLRRVADYYHATLKQRPEAIGYLRERGLVHAEVVEHFKLGYSNRTLGYRLPDKNRKAGALLRSQLQRLGVLRESGHEHLRGSLTIPIIGQDGGVLGMYGRKITPNLREGTPLHLYLPGPHRGIFNMQALSASKEIILCEALIDALTFWCAGYRNVTSSYGVEGFTREIFDALKTHGVQKVLIAYDRDPAGERAAEKLAPELAAAGMEVFRVVFPRNMDANEYALKVQPADKALGTVVRAAKWMAGSRPVAVPTELVHDAEPDVAAADGSEAPPAAPEPTPSLAAEAPEPSSTPAPPAATVEAGEDEVTLRFGPRQWRVRGLGKNSSLAAIKVSVRVMVGSVFFQDVLDVLSARARAAFLRQAVDELGIEERVLKADLGRVILELEGLLEARLREKLQPQKPGYQMSEAEREEALKLLRDPKLLDRVLADFDRCGVVGEEMNKLALYLAAVSRKLEAPLAVVIQSSSAAGKSSLMDAVLRFVPEEEQVSYSAMTGQSLFYMGATDLQHKVLAIAEERGAESAAYALKLLQSSGELTIASTGKDPATGRLVTQEYRVQGPVMVMLTTTSIDVDEELLNRCMVLTVDEGREQTRAIQRLQREARTLEGLVRKHERGRIMLLHQNAHRLLKPLHVINPFAAELTLPTTRRGRGGTTRSISASSTRSRFCTSTSVR
jgi:DNA primase